MAISIPAQSRALPPLDGDHRWWVLKKCSQMHKRGWNNIEKKLLITTNSNSKSRIKFLQPIKKVFWHKKYKKKEIPKGMVSKRHR